MRSPSPPPPALVLPSAPGAWAHAPLEKRLHELQVPVTFIYGETDWMRPEHAVKVWGREEEERGWEETSGLGLAAKVWGKAGAGKAGAWHGGVGETTLRGF